MGGSISALSNFLKHPTIDALTEKFTKTFEVFENQMVTLQNQVNNLKKTVG